MAKKYSRKRRRGGGDIEEGPDDINIPPMEDIPPDPKKYRKYNETSIQGSPLTIPPEEAEIVFSGPNPEERTKMEIKSMMDEDMIEGNPMNRPMVDWRKGRGGKTYKRRRHSSKKRNKKRRKHSSKKRRK